jgi:hypothetical protein
MNKIKSNPDKTILTICTGFVLIFLLTEIKLFLMISFSLGLIGMVSTFISRIVEKIWFKISEILGYIVPNIILSLIFYIFLFPISLVSKLFGKVDYLKLKNKETSTYNNLSKKFNKESFKNPF